MNSSLLLEKTTGIQSLSGGNLRPITSLATGRYDKCSFANPNSITLTPGYPYAQGSIPQYLPQQWTAYTHPEGQLYFHRNAMLQITTDALDVHDLEKDVDDGFEDEAESLESEPRPQASLPIPNELGAGAFFSGSRNFTINGGEYQAVNGDKHTTINNNPTISIYNIYPGNDNSPPVPSNPSNPPAAPCSPAFSTKRSPRRPRSRWSITTFTHMVYHHYLPAVMYYPMLWTGYFVPVFVPACPWP
ncbi:hypothetical protein BT96DRAFT_1004563 [Gymnopus androsaceus JB14]|uniref:WW domain-containing protein n=1 Tax=Gymnopus androsaceus JB14 TaxID=1447944 RepID=A0A6A4GQU9_9AGAR|nr:hypothetical protein BT96DRAFT_1004563 [Gymnopus androsaceus JB14]